MNFLVASDLKKSPVFLNLQAFRNVVCTKQRKFTMSGIALRFHHWLSIRHTGKAAEHIFAFSLHAFSSEKQGSDNGIMTLIRYVRARKA